MSSLYKLLVTTNLIASGLLITLSLNLPEIILRFLLVGELPDGITLLSPDTMLTIVLMGFIFTIILINPPLIVRSLNKLARSSSAKLRLPKHRYTTLQ